MSQFAKGALVQVSTTAQPQLVSFQYNPESLKRNISAAATKKESKSPKSPLEAPGEDINMTLKISAMDELNEKDPVASQYGIYPQLAALECMVNPSSVFVLANAAANQMGTTEILPPKESITLLIWGQGRVLPVTIKSYDINETYHDSKLNPIFAEVGVSLSVVKYSDVSLTDPVFAMTLKQLYTLESQAAMNSSDVSSLQSLIPQI